jgi:hypothetical protein
MRARHEAPLDGKDMNVRVNEASIAMSLAHETWASMR